MENVKMLGVRYGWNYRKSVWGWLVEMLRNENPYPYIVAEPMWDMEILADLLNEFRAQGGIVAVVSWLSMGSSQEYKGNGKTCQESGSQIWASCRLYPPRSVWGNESQ